MKIEQVGAVVGLICSAAYFTEPLGLADLPGIPTDYFVVALVALNVGLMKHWTERKGEVADVHG